MLKRKFFKSTYKEILKKYLKNTYNEKEICIVKNVADRRLFLNNYLLK